MYIMKALNNAELKINRKINTHLSKKEGVTSEILDPIYTSVNPHLSKSYLSIYLYNPSNLYKYTVDSHGFSLSLSIYIYIHIHTCFQHLCTYKK